MLAPCGAILPGTKIRLKKVMGHVNQSLHIMVRKLYTIFDTISESYSSLPIGEKLLQGHSFTLVDIVQPNSLITSSRVLPVCWQRLRAMIAWSSSSKPSRIKNWHLNAA